MTPPRAQQYDFVATVLAGTVALLFPEFAERLAARDAWLRESFRRVLAAVLAREAPSVPFGPMEASAWDQVRAALDAVGAPGGKPNAIERINALAAQRDSARANAETRVWTTVHEVLTDVGAPAAFNAGARIAALAKQRDDALRETDRMKRIAETLLRGGTP